MTNALRAKAVTLGAETTNQTSRRRFLAPAREAPAKYDEAGYIGFRSAVASAIDANGAGATPAGPLVEWSIILPFFNEHDYLPATLASIAGQSRQVRLILVDNGSTDGSGSLAATLCVELGLDHKLVVEARPGKTYALAAGLSHVMTKFVATCDADTWYPANYIAEAEDLLTAGETSAVGAYYAPAASTARQRRRAALHITVMGRLLSWQCHAGGAGQAFRTDNLRQAGGFDPSIWNWVLEDHEVMHRVAKTGRVRYGMNFWCAPANRSRDRASIRWTLFERVLYHIWPARWQGRYFYGVLGPRLLARKLSSEKIRERQYQTVGVAGHAAPDLVCG